MKNFVIGLLAVGLTSLGFSQNPNGGIREVQLEDVTLTSTNLTYLEKVKDQYLANKVISMQNEASVFDVKKLVQYDGRPDLISVKFKGNKGYILAEYDRNGKILKTLERYRDVKLPIYMTKQVLLQYPKSKILKTVYNVSYRNQIAAKKFYKIQIKHEGKKRNLKIHSDEKLNDAITISSIK